MPDDGAPVPALHARRGLAVAVVCGGAFLAPFDGAAVTVALPAVSETLGLDYAQALWVPTTYLLVVASLLLPLGALADRRGRRGCFAAGLALFAAGSLLAGAAPGVWWLLAARCCQGVGGALIVTTSAALTVQLVDPARRGRALGLNTMCVYLGAACGAPVGGLLVAAFGWRSVFLAGAGLAALLGAAFAALAPARDAVGGEPAPAPSAWASICVAVALTATLLPLTFGALWGWGSWRVLVPLLVAGLACVLLVAQQRRGERPLVSPRLYRGNRLFVAACLAALLTYTAVHGVALLTAIHLQVIEGLGPGATGAVLLVQPLVMACLAPPAGRLYDRIGSRAPTAAGALLMASGAVVLAVAAQGSWQGAAAGLALVGLGLALFSTPNISAVLGSVGGDQLSSASAVLGTSRFVGQAVSVALLGTIAAWQVAGSPGASLAGQITASDGATAFVSGYRWAMAAAALIAVAAAVVSAARGRGGTVRARPR